MKIPETVRVCGLDYKVIKSESLAIKDGLTGSHNPETLVIEVHNHFAGPARMEQVFFHELVHAIDEHYMNKKLEEDQVNALGNGIYQVLADNNFFQGDKKNGLHGKSVNGSRKRTKE